MSRSYRKNLVITEGQKKNSRSQGRGFAKRRAAKRVRKKKIEEDISDGSNYKKEFNSWDICDYKFRVEDDLFDYEEYKWKYK
jgi:hypothetical protein